MIDKKIVILHGKNKFFGQTRKPWVSLDLDKMISHLSEDGFKVESYEFQEVVNNNISIKDSIIFYSFSQRENVRNYIKDLIYHLLQFNNTVIPSFDLLMCHENKGYQELLKERIGLESLQYKYYNDQDSIDYGKINYPCVLKRVDGSNGKFVYLVRNEIELREKVRNFEHLDKLTKVDLLRRKYLRRQKKYEHYPEYSNIEDYHQYKDHVIERENFIIQEFVPDLQFDFRVLVIFDKYFVARRLNRENDFRASGAKRYDFTFEPDENILNFARDNFKKFNTPILSLDICKSGKNYYLLEYQAIHFGLNVVIRSNGFFKESSNGWNFIENKNIIEDEMAYGISHYIKSELS